MTVLTGTSGYGYPEWVGSVYPAGTKPDRFLSCYASAFPTVELNHTFYGMPKAEGIRWNLDRAGRSFIFAVKANRSLTHMIDSASWRTSAEDFKRAIEPLREAEQLAAVLFQFPPQFLNTEARRRYLFELLDEFAALPTALEFRHAGWYNNAVVDACRSRGVALVSTDLPELPGFPPLVDVVTASMAYFRFHGRNVGAWAGAGETSRYDYVYSGPELEGLAARVKGVASRVDRVFIYFNNTGMIENAREFIDILKRNGLRP